jgi:hypothetical protein
MKVTIVNQKIQTNAHRILVGIPAGKWPLGNQLFM